MASRITLVIIVGIIGASILFSTYLYSGIRPNYIMVGAGEPVKVGPVVYSIDYIGLHNGDKETKPDGKFFQIRIIAENIGAETTRLSGGQFSILDENEKRSQAVYGNFSDEDLFNEQLEPNKPVSRSTQFDIQYDEQMRYRIGILPTKIQSSIDIGIVCIQNC